MTACDRIDDAAKQLFFDNLKKPSAIGRQPSAMQSTGGHAARLARVALSSSLSLRAEGRVLRELCGEYHAAKGANSASFGRVARAAARDYKDCRRGASSKIGEFWNRKSCFRE